MAWGMSHSWLSFPGPCQPRSWKNTLQQFLTADWAMETVQWYTNASGRLGNCDRED